MTTHHFSGSITIRVKGSTKKCSWTHEFTPADLSFQDTLIPIFLKDVTIPEKERHLLTKDMRKFFLQLKNINPSSFQATSLEIKRFIKDNQNKELTIEAHGVGVYIMSQIMKNCQGQFQFVCHEFPFALLEKSFQKRVMKSPKTCQLYYSKESPYACMTSLLGPDFKWSKKSKGLVA